MPDYIFVVDTPSIKKYVFGTDKLKEIRGASAVLDHLNRYLTHKCLKEVRGNQQVNKVFANGGSGQFILQGIEQSDLIKAGESLKKLYTDGTKEASHILYGYAPLDKDYRKSLELAHFHLNNEKEKGVGLNLYHTPYSRDCDSCSNNPAVKLLAEDEELIWLCELCYNKRVPEKNPVFNSEEIEMRVWKGFGQYLKKEEITDKRWFNLRPRDFETVGGAEGYIGLVYADGNGMGRLIKEIDTPDRFTLFSETCDDAIRKACFETLSELFPLNGKGLIPADILLLGGDDLVVVMRADKAFEFAINVSDKFTNKTKDKFEQADDSFFRDKLNKKGLTISLGIAMGKSSHPFRVLLDQAEGLLSQAKKKGSGYASGLWSPPYIDFHISTHSHQLDIETIREVEYQFEKDHKTYYRTMRPYNVEDLKKLLNFAKRLKREEFPRTKLQQLYNAPFLGRENGMLKCIEVYSRCSKEERKILMDTLTAFECWDKMPWREEKNDVMTMLTDLIDLYEFTHVA